MQRALVPLVLVLSISGCSTSSTPFVEQHNNVDYHAADWARTDMGGLADTHPEPEGGIKAFTSRLDYPAELRHRHITGVMRVRVSLDASGHVLSAAVLHSIHPQLDAIVLRAVQQTRWKPAIRGGKPVPFKFSFPLTFSV